MCLWQLSNRLRTGVLGLGSIVPALGETMVRRHQYVEAGGTRYCSSPAALLSSWPQKRSVISFSEALLGGGVGLGGTGESRLSSPRFAAHLPNTYHQSRFYLPSNIIQISKTTRPATKASNFMISLSVTSTLQPKTGTQPHSDPR